jgi:arsenate reductase
MKRVLFVCARDAGRSQMAEALFNLLAEARGLALRASSAGLEPADRIYPDVVDAMRELDVDLVERRPRLLSDKQVRHAWRVIAMGCALDPASYPAIVLKDVQDWDVPDPAGRPIEQVRAIRDEIRGRVAALLDELAVSTPRAAASADGRAQAGDAAAP